MENRSDRLPSFADLEKLETVNPDVLVRVLEDYVSTGAAISGEVVVEIIKKAPVKIMHLGRMGESISIGLEDQRRRGFSRDAAEYELVGHFLSQRMNELLHPSSQ